ncbi:hypothetical protein NN561_001252 [Cricetulus griseus]
MRRRRRGWLSATGGSGFPAPRPRSPPQRRAPAGRSSPGCPAPLRPAATRAPRLPLARTPPRQPAPRGRRARREVVGFPGPRGPRRGPRGRLSPRTHRRAAGLRDQAGESRLHLPLDESRSGRTRCPTIPGDAAVHPSARHHMWARGRSDIPSPSESPPCEGCWFR